MFDKAANLSIFIFYTVLLCFVKEGRYFGARLSYRLDCVTLNGKTIEIIESSNLLSSCGNLVNELVQILHGFFVYYYFHPTQVPICRRTNCF